jgi:hypothetical protein
MNELKRREGSRLAAKERIERKGGHKMAERWWQKIKKREGTIN